MAIGIRIFAVSIAIATLLAACGGGGDAPATSATPATPVTPPPPTTPDPPAPPPSVTFSAASLRITSNMSEGIDLTNQSISLTIANRNTTSLWTRVSSEDRVFGGGNVVWADQQHGNVRIVVLRGARLGAGVYHASVRVEVCADSMCATSLQGSPFTIEVDYEVTGSAMPSTRVSWRNVEYLPSVFASAQTTAPTMKLGMTIENFPLGVVYVGGRTSTNSLITGTASSSLQWYESGSTLSVDFTVSIRPPATLGSGEFTDTMEFRACFDRDCVNEIPNSRHLLQVQFLIRATEGVQYTSRRIALNALSYDMIAPPSRSVLYVATSTASSNLYRDGDARVQTLDPVTGTLGAPVTFAGEGPATLAVSDDGSYLYAGSMNTPHIRRLALPALIEDLSIPLGKTRNGLGLEASVANHIFVLPGQPQAVAVAQLDSYLEVDDGISVYDGATRRPDRIAGSPVLFIGNLGRRYLTQGLTPGSLYAIRNRHASGDNQLDFLDVDAQGVRMNHSVTLPTTTVLYNITRQMNLVGNKLFQHEGTIRDATTGAAIGALESLAPSDVSDLLIDERHNRIFVVTLRGRVVSYDLTTGKRLALLVVNDGNSYDEQLTRIVSWGNDGIALLQKNAVIVLSGTFFSTYEGEPTVAWTPPSQTQSPIF